MASNVITAKFCADQTRAWTDELWQYDYGQILKFDGLELPDAYEVHFSNQPLTGETITQIGNADGVTIPDQFLQSGEAVYAWVYLHTGEDDGETEYMVTIPVSKRPEPSDEQPTPVEQSAIDQAIAALNIAVEKADESITHYPKIESGTWWVWDVTAEEYVDTEVEARGPQGIQGIPGQDGEDGAPGAPGEDGFSPEITVQDITGGHRITITDATGTKTVDVMDGEDGQPGQPGQPGATGNGIASITKTGTVGLVDTYTITYTNGTTTTFTVTNGSDATVTVDDALSTTSENPVQNKVINSALSDLTDDLNHKVDDVQIDGTSIVNQGVANIPMAGYGILGAVKTNSDYGVTASSGLLVLTSPTDEQIKTANSMYRSIKPSNQHQSVFYGLAKAASDTTQSASSNTVGTYTDDAKVAIQKMLGIYEAPWELIREDTFTLGTQGDIEISVDDNGETFELSDIYCTFGFPVQETDASVASYGRVRFYGVSSLLYTLYMGAWTQTAGSVARSATQLIEQVNGMVKIRYTKNATDGAEPNIQSFNAKTTGSSDNTGQCMFPPSKRTFTKVVFEAITGTALIRVYGKRKWQ